MALITCPCCGQEISDKSPNCIHCGAAVTSKPSLCKICEECGKEFDANAQACPHCGCPVEAEVIEEKDTNSNSKVKNKKYVVAAVISVVVILLLVLTLSGPSLNAHDKLAYQNAMELKSMLKDPDSLKLYDGSFVREMLDDNGKVMYTYTFINYGGANSYGANTQGQAVFKNGEYIMDWEDKDKENDSHLSVIVDMAGADLGMKQYRDTLVNVEKIKDKMGLK